MTDKASTQKFTSKITSSIKKRPRCVPARRLSGGHGWRRREQGRRHRRRRPGGRRRQQRVARGGRGGAHLGGDDPAKVAARLRRAGVRASEHFEESADEEETYFMSASEFSLLYRSIRVCLSVRLSV